jgi:hypothetical protein
LVLIGQDVLLYDFYINTNTGAVLQYVLQIGNPVWVPIFSLTLPQVSIVTPITFTAGVGQLIVPTSTLNPYQDVEPELLPILVQDLVIRYNIEAAAPTSSTFNAVIQTNPLDGIEYLIITITAVAFNSGTGAWAALTGSNKVHWFVSWLGGGN